MSSKCRTKISRAKRDLWIGSIVTHCAGYNGIVKELHPIAGIGNDIIDFQILFEDGKFCSLVHCCHFPRDHIKDIEEFFLGFAHEDLKDFPTTLEIVDAIKSGLKPFDKRGLLKPKENWNRK